MWDVGCGEEVVSWISRWGMGEWWEEDGQREG